MYPENFVYWLQGFFELSGAKTLTEEQVEVVREHLALVLLKETELEVDTGFNENVPQGWHYVSETPITIGEPIACGPTTDTTISC